MMRPSVRAISMLAVSLVVVALTGGPALGNTLVPNQPQPAHLTLVKVVVNALGGTASPSDWPLSAVGPVAITGASGSPAVTIAAVPAGDFVLSEAAGPTGFTPSAWVCVGGTLNGDIITLASAENATCTITNTEEPIEVLGTGAAVTPPVPAVVASAGSPALAFTGADGIVPMGIFGLLALVLGTGLAAAAHRVTRE